MELKLNRKLIMLGAIFSVLLLAVGLSGASSFAAPVAADFSQSTASADEEAVAGDTVAYSFVLKNSGQDSASGVVTTIDLPTGMTYVAGSYDIVKSGVAVSSESQSAQQLTVEATFEADSEATVTFDAEIAASVALSTVLQTTAVINNAGDMTNLDVSTTVVEETNSYIYMPLLFDPYPSPVLSVGPTTSAGGDNYRWTVSWTNPGLSNAYVLQESKTPDFSTILNSYALAGNSRVMTHPNSTDNEFYYRVAYTSGAGSEWSNVERAIGAYADGFSDGSSGWLKVRQDLDDTQNVLSYTGAGNLKMHVQGRWDYFVSSPLQPTPLGDYVVESTVRFEGPGNLNTYGFILGGDWNGLQCPTLIANPGPSRQIDESTVVLDPNELEESPLVDAENPGRAPVVDNCFNHYYRILLLWKGNATNYGLQVKRIDFHDAPKNSGRGPELVGFRDVQIADQNGWNNWKIEVRRSTGDFRILSNNVEVATWNDTTFINDLYWGMWASTDEYPGSDPLFDFVTVKPLP